MLAYVAETNEPYSLIFSKRGNACRFVTGCLFRKTIRILRRTIIQLVVLLSDSDTTLYRSRITICVATISSLLEILCKIDKNLGSSVQTRIKNFPENFIIFPNYFPSKVRMLRISGKR